MKCNKIDEKLAAIYHEIVHWDLMSKGKMQHGDKRPLCNMYLQRSKWKCFDCPVYKKTRRHSCKGIKSYEEYAKEAAIQNEYPGYEYFKHRAAGDFRDWLKDLYIEESFYSLQFENEWKTEQSKNAEKIEEIRMLQKHNERHIFNLKFRINNLEHDRHIHRKEEKPLKCPECDGEEIQITYKHESFVPSAKDFIPPAWMTLYTIYKCRSCEYMWGWK